MVMEAQPSPQSVGREFVRQYYTLLNKAPDHLHRFYNNSSSFLHEGLDANNREAQIVIGQKQIHNKILQLNFRDCHAKISQVDAQATLGNGVVVQVTGELSNAGQPMRRFTQTFVLGAQTPKKYYVHNDIFRYQDYYTEDEVEENGRSEGEEETEPVVEPTPQAPIYYQSNVISTSNNVYQQPPPPTTQPPQQPIPMNGLHSAVLVTPVEEPTVDIVMDNEEPQSLDMETEKETFSSVEAEQSYDDPEPISNEPKTYANLVKSGAHPYGGPAMQPPAVNLSPPPAKFNPQERFEAPIVTQKPLAQRPMRERRISNSNERNNQQQFGDSHQLFLGNIPHHATEDELRALFSRFGAIADLRILSKQNQKIPGTRPPPNYGFITYEEASSVQECLASLPLYFPDNSPDGQKLNVEEKKTRTRAPGETGGRIGGGNNFGMSNNGPRMGGGSGGLQQNRNNGIPMGGPRGGGGGNQQRAPFNPNRGGSFNRSDRNDRMGGNIGGGGGGGSSGTFVNNRR